MFLKIRMYVYPSEAQSSALLVPQESYSLFSGGRLSLRPGAHHLTKLARQ